jgi:hypothetical protein
MNALRGWGVAFLAYVAARTGAAEGAFSPTLVVTALALIGTTASVAGKEAAIRLGRRRLVWTAMVLSIAFAAILGFVCFGEPKLVVRSELASPTRVRDAVPSPPCRK